MANRITLIIHALHGGGAERVAAEMANYWAAEGHHVRVVTLDTVDSDTYPTSAGVERIGLELMRVSHNPWQALWNTHRRIRALRNSIREGAPDCQACERPTIGDQLSRVVKVRALRPHGL